MVDIIKNTSDLIVLVVLFGLTIFIHELGHFLVALRTGMVVETFSIGFGPALWKKKIRGNILIKLGCIPFGGYVALPQLDPAGMDAIQDGAKKDTEKREELPPAEPWKRIAVSFAGAAGNFLLAIVLAWIIYLGPEPIAPEERGAIVGYVNPDSAPYSLGMRPGDQIVSVNGRAVDSWYECSVECLLGSGASGQAVLKVRSADGVKDLSLSVVETKDGVPIIEGVEKASPCIIAAVDAGSSAEQAGLKANDIVNTFNGVRVAGIEHLQDLVDARRDKATPITVQRDDKPVDLVVTPRFNAEHGKALMGVQLGRVVVMPWMQYRKPGAQIEHDATAILRILQALATPKESRKAAGGLGGPVLILATLWASIKISFMNAVGFLRFLNVNLAVINLLPIPVLDGGHIVFALWERTTRRKVSPKFANVVVNAFAALLISLFVLLTFKDVSRLWDWRKLFVRSGSETPAEAQGPDKAATSNGTTRAPGGQDE